VLLDKKSNVTTVIASYSAALKLTFISGLFFFVIVAFLIVPVKLPRLGRGKSVDYDEDEA